MSEGPANAGMFGASAIEYTAIAGSGPAQGFAQHRRRLPTPPRPPMTAPRLPFGLLCGLLAWALATDGAPLLEERRQAASRLVALLELRQLRAGAAADAAPPPDAPTLPGSPPFPIQEVDRLRDERDALAAQRASLQLSVKSLDDEIDAAARQAEQQATEAAEAQLDAREHVREAAARLAVLLARSRDDLGVADQPGSAHDWLARGAAALAALGRGAWDYELFSASETTQVDGRPVTVEYGVTVGKSVGALALFDVHLDATTPIEVTLRRGS